MKVKSPIVDINHHLNQVLLAFNSLNKKLFPSFWLVDTFPDHFFFNIVKCNDAKVRTTYLNQLKNIYQNSSNSPDTMFIISNASVKNNIITFISYVQRECNIITKTVYHTMNISTTKAKLFTIRYDVSQVSKMQNITWIIIVTNTIPAAKRIFDTSYHSYQ